MCLFPYVQYIRKLYKPFFLQFPETKKQLYIAHYVLSNTKLRFAWMLISELITLVIKLS
jgi:hypothetical protein